MDSSCAHRAAFPARDAIEQTDLLDEAGIPQGVVPVHPGQFSALGFVLTDARVDLGAAVLEKRRQHQLLAQRGRIFVHGDEMKRRVLDALPDAAGMEERMSELHLGVEEGFRASAKAHPAVRVLGLAALLHGDQHCVRRTGDDTHARYVLTPSGEELRPVGAFDVKGVAEPVFVWSLLDERDEERARLLHYLELGCARFDRPAATSACAASFHAPTGRRRRRSRYSMTTAGSSLSAAPACIGVTASYV